MKVKWGHLLSTRVEAKGMRQKDLFFTFSLHPVRKPIISTGDGGNTCKSRSIRSLFLPPAGREGGVKGLSFLTGFTSIRMEPTMIESLRSRHPFLDLVQVAFILTDAHSKILYTNRYTRTSLRVFERRVGGERMRLLFLEEDLTYFLPNIIYLSLYKNGFRRGGPFETEDGAKVFVHLYTTTFKEEGEVFISFSFKRFSDWRNWRGKDWRWNVGQVLAMMVEEIAMQIRKSDCCHWGYTQRLLKTLSPLPKGKSYLINSSGGEETWNHDSAGGGICPDPHAHFPKRKDSRSVEAVLQNFSKEAAEKGISLNLETGRLEGGDFFVDKKLITKALFYILETASRLLPESR